LNFIYQQHPGLQELDTDPAGFEWIDCNDSENSIISLLRRGKSAQAEIVVVCNFTPLPRVGYRVGVPSGGFWRELLNSDAREYGGSGMGNLGGVQAAERSVHGRPYSLELTLPPLGVLFLKAKASKL
jgi:1,4-alpha-glucan branching enzyme